jgi:hypothetical protein
MLSAALVRDLKGVNWTRRCRFLNRTVEMQTHKHTTNGFQPPVLG